MEEVKHAAFSCLKIMDLLPSTKYGTISHLSKLYFYFNFVLLFTTSITVTFLNIFKQIYKTLIENTYIRHMY